MLSPPGLDLGLFRQEPAIAGLDGLFTPSHRSKECLHTKPLRTSTRFYPRFILPTARSSSFGSHPSNSRPFQTSPLINCGLFAFASDALAVILATRVHSLARYSQRTLQILRSVTHYRYQASGSFHSPLRVLFNVPSRYYSLSDSKRV
jgi:hypothetical protein